MAKAIIAFSRFIGVSSQDLNLVDVAIAMLPLPRGAAPQRLRLGSSTNSSTQQRRNQICGCQIFREAFSVPELFSVAAIRLSACFVYERKQFI
jgi:hypothetical protein